MILGCELPPMLKLCGRGVLVRIISMYLGGIIVILVVLALFALISRTYWKLVA
jgi:hypothetical protein